MSEHVAAVSWSRNGRPFTYDEYSRDHELRFEGGTVVAASASAHYRGSAALVDPEEAFVAALSSCHLLSFLAIAARKRLVVESYVDRAVGWLESNAEGRLAVTRVRLEPSIEWGGRVPDQAVLDRMHHLAHQECFIANSVTTEVTVVTR